MTINRNLAVVSLAFLMAAPHAGADTIHDAAGKGDLARVREILAAAPDAIRAVNERGYTPLHVAVGKGRVDVAALLLDKGADLEAKNPSGFTPLFLAVNGNHPEAVRFLLAKGADPNAETRFKTTPLFTAAESGEVPILRVLIEGKGDVNHVSPIFGSPLHRAAYLNFQAVAKALLDAGADLKVRDQRGQTPLHQAAQLGNVDAAGLFIERGAEIDAFDGENRTPLQLAVNWGTDRAGSNNSSELAFLLMSKGARVDLPDKGGSTPLLTAVSKGLTELAAAILRRGGDVRTREPGTGRTLLHLAALRGFADMADLLLARGADAAAKDAAGKTALDYANEHGHPTLALRLVSSIGGMSEPEIGARILAKAMSGGEACLWSLDNRGLAVKTGSRLFVFDNEEQGRRPDWPSLSNGWISAAEISGQDIIALYSAYHALPDTMEFIHGLEKTLPRIRYINYKDDAWRGGDKTVYLKGREIQRFGDAEIIPYETIDEGGMGSLGYLVKADGLVLFYPNFFPEDIESFKKEIDFLAELTPACDMALIDTAPEQWNAYAAYLIEKLKPRVVIPFDRSSDDAARKARAAELARKYPAVRVRLFRDAGDKLHYRNGKLED